MCIYGIPELRRLGIPFLVLALLPSALSLSSIYAGSDSREESISDVPIREQVPLLLEALPWDRTFQKRIKKGFHFGILYTDSDTSQEALREVMTLFSRWSSGSTGKKGNSRSVAVNAHEFKWSGPAALARALDSQPIAALYILPGNEAHLEEIIKVVDERDVLSLSSISQWVKRGLAVGVVRNGEQFKLWINIKAARSEGADFSSKLLKIATIVD